MKKHLHQFQRIFMLIGQVDIFRNFEILKFQKFKILKI